MILSKENHHLLIIHKALNQLFSTSNNKQAKCNYSIRKQIRIKSRGITFQCKLLKKWWKMKVKLLGHGRYTKEREDALKWIVKHSGK